MTYAVINKTTGLIVWKGELMTFQTILPILSSIKISEDYVKIWCKMSGNELFKKVE